MAISEKSEKVLRAIQHLKEAEITAILAAVPSEDTRNIVAILAARGYIAEVRVLNRVLPGSNNAAVSVYALSEKGGKFLNKLDSPAPKAKAKTPAVKKQKLHPAETFVIPECDPDVDVVYLKVNGRTVKVTYGKHFKREPYKSPPELTRYKANPIKGIHAL